MVCPTPAQLHTYGSRSRALVSGKPCAPLGVASFGAESRPFLDFTIEMSHCRVFLRQVDVSCCENAEHKNGKFLIVNS